MLRLATREIKTLVAVHGWVGALVGVVLYAVVVTGTVAVFSEQINTWSGGLIGKADPLTVLPLNATIDKLTRQTPKEFRDQTSIFLAPGDNVHAYFFLLDYLDGELENRGVYYMFDPAGKVLSRTEGWGDDLLATDPRTALGSFFVNLHVRLHLPETLGLIVTGILGLAMLSAAVSGMLMHRHLFTDIFTLRGKHRMVGLRDVHSVAGTWTLPHAFVLAFTGAYLSFAFTLGAPLLSKIAFNGDHQALNKVLFQAEPAVTDDPTPAPKADLDAVVADARARAGAPVVRIRIENRGRADARVTVRTEPRNNEFFQGRLVYDGVTGEFLRDAAISGRKTNPSFGGLLLSLVAPLHFGSFLGWISRFVWFALGAATAYVTLSGLTLWVRRRSDQRAWRVVARVIAWIGGGLPLVLTGSAIGYFAALPSLQTVYWTPVAFLICTAMTVVIMLSIRRIEKLTPVLFGLTGAMLVSLPMLRRSAGGFDWDTALAAGQNTIPLMDGFVFFGGLTCIFLSALALRERREPIQVPPIGHLAE